MERLTDNRYAKYWGIGVSTEQLFEDALKNDLKVIKVLKKMPDLVGVGANPVGSEPAYTLLCFRTKMSAIEAKNKFREMGYEVLEKVDTVEIADSHSL